MVTSDTGLPDPDNPNSELRASSNGGIMSITDDDESDLEIPDEYDQYRPLSMDESANSNDESEEEAHEIEARNNSTLGNCITSAPALMSMEDSLLKELWSGPPPKEVEIEMNNKKIDEIKQAMLNVTLPLNSIPEWARCIPEEEWKQTLMKHLHVKGS